MHSRKVFLLIAIGIVTAFAGALAARWILQSPQGTVTELQSGTRLWPPKSLPDFALLDQDAQPFGNAQLVGHWNLLFFGFTNCGDVCPTTLALLAKTRLSLTDLPVKTQPQVVFFSVDTKRDTPERVKQYVHNFDPSFIGVTGTQQEVEKLTNALGVPSAIRLADNGIYAVDHSAAILAIDPSGKLAALFTPPQTLDGLALDYRRLTGTQ